MKTDSLQTEAVRAAMRTEAAIIAERGMPYDDALELLLLRKLKEQRHSDDDLPFTFEFWRDVLERDSLREVAGEILRILGEPMYWET